MATTRSTSPASADALKLLHWTASSNSAINGNTERPVEAVRWRTVRLPQRPMQLLVLYAEALQALVTHKLLQDLRNKHQVQKFVSGRVVVVR